MGAVSEAGVPSPVWKGLCSPAHENFFFDFRARNGEISCILDATVYSSAGGLHCTQNN